MQFCSDSVKSKLVALLEEMFGVLQMYWSGSCARPDDNYTENRSAVFDDTGNQSSRNHRTKPRRNFPEYVRSREEGDSLRPDGLQSVFT
jgi:hypothetical protein